MVTLVVTMQPLVSLTHQVAFVTLSGLGKAVYSASRFELHLSARCRSSSSRGCHSDGGQEPIRSQAACAANPAY